MCAANSLDLQGFCKNTVSDFTALGGRRPDTAVVACAMISLHAERLFLRGVILPPDVLDTSLALVCAPPIVTHATDMGDWEAHFRCSAVSIRLMTINANVLDKMKIISDCMPCELTVSMRLSDSVADKKSVLQRMGAWFLSRCPVLTTVILPDVLTEVGPNFLAECCNVQYLDLKNTALRKVGGLFAYNCRRLIAVVLPDTVTQVGGFFLSKCVHLQHIDLKNTALQKVDGWFAKKCSRLTTVVLPDSVTEVGVDFLSLCGPIEVVSGSPSVQAAAAKHMTQEEDR